MKAHKLVPVITHARRNPFASVATICNNGKNLRVPNALTESIVGVIDHERQRVVFRPYLSHRAPHVVLKPALVKSDGKRIRASIHGMLAGYRCNPHSASLLVCMTSVFRALHIKRPAKYNGHYQAKTHNGCIVVMLDKPGKA